MPCTQPVGSGHVAHPPAMAHVLQWCLQRTVPPLRNTRLCISPRGRGGDTITLSFSILPTSLDIGVLPCVYVHAYLVFMGMCADLVFCTVSVRS